jgi:outer membrane protein assembly factor BamE (lipoprotein component of BamABCDE complex)
MQATRRTIIPVALAASFLTACVPAVDYRGNLPDEQAISQIKPGTTDRESVRSLLGSPTSAATFDDQTWYYISKKTETVAFMPPKVLDQQVLRVTFRPDGIVRDVDRWGPNQAREVQPAERVTPTAGHNLGFFEQLFGNLGRFNSNPKGSAGTGGGSGSPGGGGMPGN